MPAVTASPIAVALDFGDLAIATSMARAVSPFASTLKVGLQLFMAEGPAAVEKIRMEAPDSGIMLDVKLHDIPATVRGAARSLAASAPQILTVHAIGGPAMVEAAVEELPETEVAAVTILTSHSAADLELLGISGPPLHAVTRLAQIAVGAGARALVCSPQEVAAVREAVGPGIRLITPGVRPVGATTDDQSRIATPEQALADGADLLVIGRPITGADDPRHAAEQIALSLQF